MDVSSEDLNPLILLVVGAENLPHVHATYNFVRKKLPSPFVRISIDNYSSGRTRSERRNSSPIWNEYFEIGNLPDTATVAFQVCHDGAAVLDVVTCKIRLSDLKAQSVDGNSVHLTIQQLKANRQAPLATLTVKVAPLGSIELSDSTIGSMTPRYANSMVWVERPESMYPDSIDDTYPVFEELPGPSDPYEHTPSFDPKRAPNVRQSDLAMMEEYVLSERRGNTILWVYGPTGSGKTTLASAIGNAMSERDMLWSVIHLDLKVNPTGHLAWNLASKLAEFDDQCKYAIDRAAEEFSAILDASLAAQFHILIRAALRNGVDKYFSEDDEENVHPSRVDPSRRLVLVIDGLDDTHCVVVQELWEALVTLAYDKHSFVRIIITSRSANPPSPHRRVLIHSIDPAESQEIDAYIASEGIQDVDERTNIVAKAGGNWLWIVTAAVAMRQPSLGLKEHIIAPSPASTLDNLFRSIASSLEHEAVITLALIATARSPLSLEALKVMQPDLFRGGIPEHQVMPFVREGNSSDISDSLTIFHPAFGEFLNKWLYEEKGVCCHHLHFRACIYYSQIVSSMSDLGTWQYATSHWVDHLRQVSLGNTPLDDREIKFIQNNIREWVVVTCQFEGPGRCVRTMTELLWWRKFNGGQHKKTLAALIRPLRAFCQAFHDHLRRPATFEPLQRPVTFEHFASSSFNTARLAFLHPLIFVLTDQKDRVYSASFSPDSKLVATRSHNDTICVWSTSTGLLMFPSLKCADHSAAPVTFSDDGKRILASSHTREYVWDATTGQEVATDPQDLVRPQNINTPPAVCPGLTLGSYRFLAAKRGETIVMESMGETVLQLPSTFLDLNSKAPPSPAGVYRRLAEVEGMMLLQSRADFMLLIHLPPFIHLVPD